MDVDEANFETNEQFKQCLEYFTGIFERRVR